MAKRFDKKTYVVTSAQGMQSGKHADKYGRDSSLGAPNKNLINGLEKYCEKNDAELVFLKMKGRNASEYDMNPFFENRGDVYDPFDRKLNSNIAISSMIVPPQNVDPATGRGRFAQNETTLVYAHPKQRFKAIPASNCDLPKLLITTGACTLPNYAVTNHRGDVAMRDHRYGAVVVEVIDDKFYNVRHIPAQQNGKFVDMGQKYNGNSKPSKSNVEALVWGDLHLGDHDEKTMQANYEMIDFFKPKRLVIHDGANGHSVNGHEKDNLLTRAREFKKGRLSIEEELKLNQRELATIGKKMRGREVLIPDANHPFFFNRYLERGDFLKEPWNAEIALKLASKMIEGENPVEYGIRMMGPLPSNIKFLKSDDDHKVWGWQLASHGHKGNSGARGSINSREIGHGKSITGHTHTPELLRDTMVVGTSTKLSLPYTEGSGSSWMAANGVLYEGGLAQLLPIINGKWKMER